MRSLDLTELTRRLIAFNTVSTKAPKSTKPIADFISEYCEGVGFKIEQYSYTEKGQKMINVIARKGGEKSHLALSGHMDTVAFKEPKDENEINPLVLTLKGDRYYGRGTADMKLFLAIAIKTGEAIKEHTLKKPFALCFTSSEEVGCLGARKLTEKKVHIANSIIIGEPTELVPIYMHKGYMFIKIILEDRHKEEHRENEQKRHSSDPRGVCNIIEEGLVPTINQLVFLKNKLRIIEDARFDPPFPTLNIGVVNSGEGSSKNVIPATCIIELDIRPLPGQDIDELYETLQHVIKNGITHNDVLVKIKYGRKYGLAMEESKKATIVQLAEKISGQTAKTTCFYSEGGIFKKHGYETVVWGPGSIKQAHKHEEFVNIKYFKQNIIDKYIEVIKRSCC